MDPDPLQDDAQARAMAFLDRCRAQWRPEQMGLDRATLEAVLTDLPRFVCEAGLPHSILDETELGGVTVDRRLDPILALTPTDHH